MSILTYVCTLYIMYLVFSELVEVLLVQLVHGVFEVIPQTLSNRNQHKTQLYCKYTHTRTHMFTFLYCIHLNMYMYIILLCSCSCILYFNCTTYKYMYMNSVHVRVHVPIMYMYVHKTYVKRSRKEKP
jgi:hypothetical protein